MQHHMDSSIGVHIIDRWTYYALEFLERVNSGSKATLQQFVSSCVCVCVGGGGGGGEQQSHPLS